MEEKTKNYELDRYKTQLKPAYENKNYDKIHKLLNAFPYLINYLTKFQATEMTKYLLEKNNLIIKEMKSNLEKTLTKLEDMDK